MTGRQKKWFIFIAPALLVLVLDQLSKYVIRTTPALHRETLIEGWLSFTFIKNPGMAMGIDLLPTPVISVIAVVATLAIIGYVWRYLDRSNLLYLTCMGLVVGGAAGNISDRIFMGLIGGYGGVFEGHVVDFIHFTLEIGDWAVFPYIFNVADIAISVSIILMLLFHRVILPDVQDTPHAPDAPDAEASSSTPDAADTPDTPHTPDAPDASDTLNAQATPDAPASQNITPK